VTLLEQQALRSHAAEFHNAVACSLRTLYGNILTQGLPGIHTVEMMFVSFDCTIGTFPRFIRSLICLYLIIVLTSAVLGFKPRSSL